MGIENPLVQQQQQHQRPTHCYDHFHDTDNEDPSSTSDSSRIPINPHELTFEDETARIQGSMHKVTSVMSSPNRLSDDRIRDQIRLPLQLIPFLDVKHGQRILDFSAWDGYWSTLFVQMTELPIWCHNVNEWKAFSDPQIQRRFGMTDRSQNPNGSDMICGPMRFYNSTFQDPTPPMPSMCTAPDCVPCRTKPWPGWNSLFDIIFSYTNYHDSRADLSTTSTANPQLFLQKCYNLLKPGGHLIIIDHAAFDGSGTSCCKDMHRIDERVVVEEVSEAGFELVKGEVVLRDQRDERNGVPWVAGTGALKFTDRFALKFRKPGGRDQALDAWKCIMGYW
ncbi:hypothetical protein HDU76_005748 [Blyttiomyces sp. JEL0837]|nr:hypothetical protein HDU76_005748 [Blyttiomyces sp. JEL0837]